MAQNTPLHSVSRGGEGRGGGAGRESFRGHLPSCELLGSWCTHDSVGRVLG